MISALRKSLSFLTFRQRLVYFTLIIARAFSGLLDVLGIALIALLTALAANNIKPDQPLVVLGFELPKVSERTLLFLVFGVLIVFLLKAAIAISLGKVISLFLYKIESQKAIEVAEYLLRGDLSNLTRFDKGEIAWSTMGSANIAFSGLLTSLSVFVSEGTLLVFMAITFFVVDPVATIFVIIYFTLIILIIQFAIAKALKQAGEDLAEGNIRSMVVLDDTIGAFREIKVLNKQSHFIALFKESRTRMARSGATTTFLNGMPRYVVETALMLGVVIFVGFQFVTGQLATGLVTVGVFLTGGVRIMASLLPLQGAIAGVKIQIEQSRFAQDLLEQASRQQPDSSSSKEQPLQRADVAVNPNAPFKIEMENLCYRYPDSDNNVLHNVSFEIGSGQHIAFIGPSGAGKTTIVDLLLGLMEPTSGRILVDGSEANHRALIERGLVAYVPQRPGIVSGSIAENIALGENLVEIDEDRVMEALEAAHLTEFVTQLPQGIYSSVGNQADALSGGQIQRIGLARALYHAPKLLVLDEATSALDANSEAYISESLKKLGSDVTVIVIAHRLSTVQHADLVFLVEGGQISASGKFGDLRANVPMVAEYVKLMSFDDDSGNASSVQ